MKNIDRCSRIHNTAIALKNGMQKAHKLLCGHVVVQYAAPPISGQALRNTFYGHIVRRIRDNQVRLGTFHQPGDIFWIRSITTDQSMWTKLPHITTLRLWLIDLLECLANIEIIFDYRWIYFRHIR
ncbi:hypothetical protein D1872_270890 [compost metagenome]